ncbi:MAG: carboxylating nicotinate-nucleotide diphosphorylase [Clostridia bacterium]|nr:carboxylating nicotinate-nucleotide diphosphorylase [Clostridia bacterium]
MIDKDIMRDFIKRSLQEDIGTGDITTLSTVPEGTKISGRFIAKESGIICGIEVARAVFDYADKSIEFNCSLKDGEHVNKGDIIGTISGDAASVLTGERLALNLMQRMSGIATNTNEAVQKVSGYKAKIVDTRKTTPGLRVFEKYAVKAGGGANHRFNLADGVLIKDNHIKAAGGITKAVEAARRNAPHTLKIEVEVETIQQLNEALKAGADIIMLDNMDNNTMTEAVKIAAGRAIIEASGNMGEKDLEEVAKTGVDIISIGALTHSVKALDISLKFD